MESQYSFVISQSGANSLLWQTVEEWAWCAAVWYDQSASSEGIRAKRWIDAKWTLFSGLVL